MRKAPIILYMIEKQVGEDAFKKVCVGTVQQHIQSPLLLLF